MGTVPRPPLPPGPYLVVGLARSGTAAARALAARGEHVTVVDRGAPAHDPLPDGVDVRCGDDGIAALDSVRTVISSPGVPFEAPVLVAARERGLDVLGELEVAWRLVPVPVIAITGTNGKTTTTELLGHLLRDGGTDPAVVGNVGTPYSTLALPGAEMPDLVVCEASSFQLEAAPLFAPDIGVLLNLGTDHLDRHGTIERYHASKLSMFDRQGEGSCAVVPLELAGRVGGRARKVTFGAGTDADLVVGDDRLSWHGATVIERSRLMIAGPHNAENAAAAAAALIARGADPEQVGRGLESFPGVPHRLERVAERDGVLWVNDSKATNVAAAIVALRSFGDRPVHVILGGRGKDESYTPLREPLAAYARRAYVIGEEADRIGAAIDDVLPVEHAGTLEAAVAAARRATGPGDVILLAPACASQDQFTDFEERGQVFSELARKTG